MSTEYIVLIIIIMAGFGALFYLLKSKPKAKDSPDALIMLQNQVQEIVRTLDGKLGESTRLMQEERSQSMKVITDVVEKLTRLEETNKQVLGFSEQLERLQDVLKNPKQRGVFGEYYLDTLLSKAFQPNQYEMQYHFADGLIVDAILHFGDKIIPIDSKFSLENYNRIVEEADPVERERLEKLFKQDLKNRIDETAQYIRPNEGTVEFAFMFIPAEGIYYDLLVNKVGALKVNTRDLLEYAVHEKKVHIVSPTTFYVTLQSLMVGMRAYSIQESTKEIIKNVGQLGKHIKAYDEYFKRLGNNLNTTVNSYNTAQKELGKIDKDVVRVSGGDRQIAAIALEAAQVTDEEILDG